MLPGPSKPKVTDSRLARPYCACTSSRLPMPWQLQLQELELATDCACGEEDAIGEWTWQEPEGNVQNSLEFSKNDTQVTFHPTYSSGTATVRGDCPFHKDHHHYFEIKMLTDTYGTDIMVGVGTDKVNIAESRYKFTSLLGEDDQSYGLSYRGMVRHGAGLAHESAGFCRGSIVGVRVDLWHGTLEFYVNRKPQGISFFNLRRHQQLYPMVSSTAAQSKIRLIYAASWRASLLVDAAKILAASTTADSSAMMPPGLWRMLKPHFWMFMPTEDAMQKKSKESEMEFDKAEISESLLGAVLPSRYMNGFYMDGVAPGYQLVLWEDTGIVN
ncbi:SPRY domain-containing SOCS box protein 3-like isoform X1 [Choristoneura fumiferana]|uniref:SPRY domain-containing SOCS box protein 3-like isoform X1 n=1 Tax=Choristoneura fumiferana TaxID=7141 RepID=UPI003D157B4E